MTYDYELILIGQTEGENEIGDPISTDSEVIIFCGIKSVGRNEFYSAATAGLKPEIVFIIHAYEYDGQQTVIFENNRYAVIRTYAISTEEMELTCSGLVNGVM
ncbi:phage head closure protein [Paenibacillus sp. LMG 31461]|uniref:Phage head closure protein n=1 Tax=Paenibacillus plantarum TaxID=2654975 RepID=A0ABX1X440_9BACL|nr:phage head closure protein [Paenibacillus plantarum]NOU63175.1 phage head closure protein [Paenibacillus plantarum]